MESIQVKVASRLLAFFQIALSLIAAMFGVKFIGDLFNIHEKTYVIALLLALWSLTYFTTRKLPQGLVELRVQSEGIQITWLKQIVLFKQGNHLLKWTEMKDYMYQPEQYFDLFRIRMNDKRKFNFSLIGNNPDFHYFLHNLETTIEKKSKLEGVDIVKANNIYQSKFGLIWAIFCCIVIAGGIIAFFIIEPKPGTERNLSYLLVPLMVCIFSVLNVWQHRRKNKK